MSTSDWILAGGYLLTLIAWTISVLEKLESVRITSNAANETGNKLRDDVAVINVKLAEHSIEISHVQRTSEKHDARLTRLENYSSTL